MDGTSLLLAISRIAEAIFACNYFTPMHSMTHQSPVHVSSPPPLMRLATHSSPFLRTLQLSHLKNFSCEKRCRDAVMLWERGV